METVKAAASQAKSSPPVPVMAPSIAASDPVVVPARSGPEEAGKNESLIELGVKRQRIMALFRNSNTCLHIAYH